MRLSDFTTKLFCYFAPSVDLKKKMTLEDVPEITSNAIAPSHDLVVSPARMMVIMVSPNLRVSMYSNPKGEGTSVFSSQMTTQLASIHP